MARRVALLAVAALVLLALASALLGAWAVASRPGSARLLSLPPIAGRGVAIALQPCQRRRSGRVVVWYADVSRPNRLNPGTIRTVLALDLAPACP